jgi:hypothetical protein
VLAFITCLTFICFGVNTEENNNEIERGKKKKKERNTHELWGLVYDLYSQVEALEDYNFYFYS